MVDQNLTTINHHRLGSHFTNHRFQRHINPLHFGFSQPFHSQLGILFTFSNDFLVADFDLGNSTRANEFISFKFNLNATLRETIGPSLIKTIQDLLSSQAQRLEQDSGRHFATQIDTEIDMVLGIKLKIEP